METSQNPENRRTLENPYFDILASGRFEKEQVKVNTLGPLQIPQYLRNRIDETWLKKPGQDNPQVILRKLEVGDGKLRLSVSESSFKDFQGTRSEEIREKFRRRGLELPDILGTNLLVKTKDGKLLVIKRGESAATKPGAMSVPGGYPDLEEDSDGQGNWDPFKTAIRELREETGIEKPEINQLFIEGVIYNKGGNQPSMIFMAESELNSWEIAERKGSDEEEKVQTKFIDDDERSLRETVLWWTFYPSPSGSAALTIYGKNKYGNVWYENIQERLNYRYQRLYSKLSKDQLKNFERRPRGWLKKL